MAGGAPHGPNSITLADNPFVGGNRGFDSLPAPWLLAIRARYESWADQFAAERVWLRPTTGQLYVAAILAEIDEALAVRGAAA